MKGNKHEMWKSIAESVKWIAKESDSESVSSMPEDKQT